MPGPVVDVSSVGAAIIRLWSVNERCESWDVSHDGRETFADCPTAALSGKSNQTKQHFRPSA